MMYFVRIYETEFSQILYTHTPSQLQAKFRKAGTSINTKINIMKFPMLFLGDEEVNKQKTKPLK